MILKYIALYCPNCDFLDPFLQWTQAIKGQSVENLLLFGILFGKTFTEEEDQSAGEWQGKKDGECYHHYTTLSGVLTLGANTTAPQKTSKGHGCLKSEKQSRAIDLSKQEGNRILFRQLQVWCCCCRAMTLKLKLVSSYRFVRRSGPG